VAAIGLILSQLAAANVEAGLDRVRAAGEGQIAHVLKGVFAPQNRQRSAMADARVTRRAEDGNRVLLLLLVGVWHTELDAELIIGLHAGLREIELKTRVTGSQI